MRKKILVADDNRAITEVLQLNFSLLGYEVHVASDGEEAERKCRAVKPDILILDVMMPKKNGYKVCRNLKLDEDTSGTPIILLTAKNLKEDVYWGYDSGADAYMTKPYDPRQLEILVDQLIKETETGLKTTAWTGLPVATRVDAEHRQRLEAGAPSILLEISFPPESVAAYSSKYGSARAKDFIHRWAWLLYEKLQSAAAAGVLGQTREDRFRVAIRASELPAFRALISEAFQELLGTSYDAADLQRGRITWPDSGSGKEAGGAIMTLQMAEVEPPPE
jgi:twitching motility two-component system response regulator PilH